MARYRLTFLRGGEGSAIVEATSPAAALEAAYILPAGSREIEGRGTVHFGRRYMEETGEVLGCAAVLDRLPSDAGKGAYRTAGERTPQDRGGSIRKHRSPQPFAPAPRDLPDDCFIPSGGLLPNRAELAAAQRDLAAAGLGTLNGQGFGTAVMVLPEHYAGVRTIRSDASAPLAILAARVTPREDSDPRTGQPTGFDPDGL